MVEKRESSMRNMIKKIKNKTFLEKILLILVIIQIAYLVLYNLLHNRNIVNFDTSTYYMMIMQVVKQKTLFISDYYYSTMNMWDSPLFIAIIFYALFKDVFLAVGLGNIVVIICMSFIISKLCKDIGMSNIARYISLLLVFTVYKYGFVDYVEELFINAAWYGTRVLIFLAYLDIVICLHKKTIGKPEKIIMALVLIGMFLCGVSSGIYILGFGILPILVFELSSTFRETKKIRICDFVRPSIVYSAFASAMVVVGIILNHILGFGGSSAENKMTVAATDLMNNIFNSIIGYFQLLGWPNSSVSIMSIQGIIGFISFILAMLILISALIVIYISVFKKRMEINDIKIKYGQILFWVAIVHIVIMGLSNLAYGSETTEYRYWLILVIVAMIGVGLVYDYIRCEESKNRAIELALILVIMLSCINVVKDKELWDVDYGHDIYTKALKVAENEGCDVTFICGNDYFQSRAAVVFNDSKMEVFAVSTSGPDNTGAVWIDDSLYIQRWGAYVKYDGDCIETSPEGTVGVMITKNFADYDFLRSKADKIVEVEGTEFEIFKYKENVMDFTYGIPTVNGNKSQDYFIHGYETKSAFKDEQGRIASNIRGDNIIKGNFVSDHDGKYDIELEYDSETMADVEMEVQVISQSGRVDTYTAEKIDKNRLKIIGVLVEKDSIYNVSISKRDSNLVHFDRINYISR